MNSKIDAHMHVWKMARGDYDWLTPDLSGIYRDFGIDDAWGSAAKAGVSGVILVQAAATAAETDYMLSIAANDNRVAGVVGWVDFEALSARKNVARLAEKPHIVGLRPMIADLPDPAWILRQDLKPALEAMEAGGLVLDGHAHPDLVPVMSQLADDHPGLQIVLNHGGKPPIESRQLDAWREDIADLARRKNVACKISGLLTEAGTYTDDESIGSVVCHLGTCFGPDRLLWGSDWPVLTLASAYESWMAQSGRLFERYFPDHQDRIWSGNAERIYLGHRGG